MTITSTTAAGRPSGRGIAAHRGATREGLGHDEQQAENDGDEPLHNGTYFLAAASASFLRYFAGSLSNFFLQLLQHSLISCPSWTNV